MTLQDALSNFKKLEAETTKKAEIKVYQKFIQVLTSLENRNLSDVEIQAIEQELEALALFSTPANDKRYFNKAFRQFQQYLKETFSLTTKGYYTGLGIGLGASFGVVFGIVLLSSFERSLGISLGITLGMLIGLIIGRNLDAQAMALDKML
jgi:hypothetical protein